MSHMQKLTFSTAERAVTRSDPIARSQNKMLAAIEAQIALIRAEDAGETYVVTKRRWVTDPDTEVSWPPFDVPPVSLTETVTVADPFAFALRV